MILLLNILYFISLILIYYSFENKITINAKRSSGHKHHKYWNFRQQTVQSDKSSIEERIIDITPKYCGLKLRTSSYIVGGEESVRNEFPFMVTIRNDYVGHTCGGTIISDRWILTAAHCANPSYTHKSNGVIAGAHEYSMGDKYYITRVIQHKKYAVIDGQSVFDIALVRTDRKIRFNSNVNAICLPTIPESESFGVITAIGWGVVKMKNKVDEEQDRSPVLRKVNLTIISDQKCAEIYADLSIQVIHSFLCAKHIGKSVCYADSGSPAFKYINGRAVIVGIAAWIEDDYCTAGKINVFMQVSYFLDWILLNIDS